MSTNDVPGAKTSNGDSLAMGCWAEHADGSLIFVTSTENDRVIYSMFDMAHDCEYRDAMPTTDFKTAFSWPNKHNVQWTWHDKTPFPWDRVIKAGAKPGTQALSAGHILTKAEQVAKSLALRAQKINRDQYAHMSSKKLGRIDRLVNRLSDLLGDNLPKP